MTDLTPTQRAVRVLVAQHLPEMIPSLATSYATLIHIDTPLAELGLPWGPKITDGARCALLGAIEALYRFEADDDAWFACDNVRQLAALVERHAQAVAA